MSAPTADEETLDEEFLARFVRFLGHERFCIKSVQTGVRGAQEKHFDLINGNKAVDYIRLRNGKRQLWVNVQKLKKDAKQYHAFDDIGAYTNIFIDIDAKKPDDKKDFAATKKERGFALAQLPTVQAWLDGKGFKPGLAFKSGNGAGLLLPIPPTPPTPEFIAKVAAFLKVVRREANVDVDTTTFDPPRVCGILQTWNTKTEDEDEGRKNHLREAIGDVPARDEDEALLKYIERLDPDPEALRTWTEKFNAPPTEDEDEGEDAEDEEILTHDIVDNDFVKAKLGTLLEADPKLQGLLDWSDEEKERHKNNRSDAEFGLVGKLTAAGFSDPQIGWVMTHVSKIGKWAEEGEHYQQATLRKIRANDAKEADEIKVILPNISNDVQAEVDQNLFDQVFKVEEADKNHPYGVGSDGITYKRVTKDKAVFFVKIADGFGFIESQTRRENGDAIFTIRGRGSQDGHEFTFDIDAGDFSETRKLKAKLTAQFGGSNVLKKDFNSEAIQRLTKKIKNFRLIEACRWIDGMCAVPGLDLVDDAKYAIHKKVPCDFSERGDLDQGTRALKALMQAWHNGHMAISLATVLGAPITAEWWPDDRYALALIGLTGTGKTEAMKLLLACYGRGYLFEYNLVRWNSGTTANALQTIAAESGFLPILADNYKQIDGKSQGEMVKALHSILEGSEKARMERSANKLRDSKQFSCLPIITGESFIEETSTLARSVVLEWQPIADVTKLDLAQSQADNLLEVGRSWLTWISSSEGKAVIEEVRAGYPALRSEAVKVLTDLGCINSGRIGSTMALIKSLWIIITKHPEIGPAIKQHSNALSDGLVQVMLNQAEDTVSANEGERFVSGLRELITTGRATIVMGAEGLGSVSVYEHPERVLGWTDDDGRYWIYPEIAKRMVAQLQGRQVQDLDSRTLFRQIADRDYVDIGKQHTCIRSRDPKDRSKFKRFLVFKAEVGLDHVHTQDEAKQINHDEAAQRAHKTAEDQDVLKRLEAVTRIV